MDRISGILTRRNNGIREPEHILPNFIVPTLLAFLGLVVYGVVAGNPAKYHWIGVHISLGIYFCGFIAISAMTGMWIGDATPHYSGAGLVLVCGGRNALSFAIRCVLPFQLCSTMLTLICSNNFPRWIAGQGFANAYIQLGSVILGVVIVGGVPMFFFNKRIRRVWTKKVKFDLK